MPLHGISSCDRSSSEYNIATGLPIADRNSCHNGSVHDSSSTNAYVSQEHSSSEQAEASCDLWVCLLCGFIGCGSSHCNHIRQHYERHLHAYAMNTGKLQYIGTIKLTSSKIE